MYDALNSEYRDVNILFSLCGGIVSLAYYNRLEIELLRLLVGEWWVGECWG